MRRFENYWVEEAQWEAEQEFRRREKRRRTREQRRVQAREQMLTITAVTLFLVIAVLANTIFAESAESAETAPAETQTGEQEPVRILSLPEQEVQEDYENKKIEAALLERSHKLTDVKVTHYCPCQKCCGKSPDHPAYGITASGRKLVPGVSVGVDPQIIPLGSTGILDFGDGELHYCVADDTGAGVNGNHIDLAMASHQEALEAGVRMATVYWCEEDVG